MGTTPSSSTTVSSSASAPASGDDLICVWSPVPSNADMTPRIYANPAGIFAQHGYSGGLEYSALHIAETRKPVMFIGMPIDVPGVIGRLDTSGNAGSSAVSVAAGGSGVLWEHDGDVTVIQGGTIGTDQIILGLSLDGGRTRRRVRLGTASSYTLPYVGASMSFGAGTLVAGNTIATWHGTAPTTDAASMATARLAMKAQQKLNRTCLLIGDCPDATLATAFLTQIVAYDTADQRATIGRASVRDRLPYATLGVTSHRMTGAPSLTFAEVGATGDTITRAAGSWLSDGFAVGDKITITGTASNNVTAIIDALSATVITLDTEDLAAEVTALATVVGEPALAFANSGDTITRNRGSWLDDGFRVGDLVTIEGTSGGTNDVVGAEIVTLTALVMTLATGGVDADESIGVSELTTFTAGQTKAVWMAAADATFAAVSDNRLLDLSAGRARKFSAIDSWFYRFPIAWLASIREYQHDLHIATWRKEDGAIVGASLLDAEGNLVEFDDRVDGGGSLARFTTAKSYANGPNGVFISQSLTRAADSDLLSQTHKSVVVNKAKNMVTRVTEDVAIGADLILNADGTATRESLSILEKRVNRGLKSLAQDNSGEGANVSSATWVAEPSTDFNVPTPTLVGTLTLVLKGTVHSVVTTIRVGSSV